MVQRIQSLYLIGVIVCQSLLFATALATFSGYDSSYNLSIFGFYKLTSAGAEQLLNYYTLMIVNVIIILFTWYIVMSYKNRRLQMRLASFNVLMLSAFIVLMFFDFDNANKFISEANNNNTKELSTTYGIGMALPVLSIILNIFAIRGIKKDDDLMKSADRIR